MKETYCTMSVTYIYIYIYIYMCCPGYSEGQGWMAVGSGGGTVQVQYGRLDALHHAALFLAIFYFN